MNDGGPLLDIQKLHKSYAVAMEPLHVLKGVDLRLDAGETAAIVGPSGCGKSTLLNIAGALDRSDSGRVAFDGRELEGMNDAELARFRNRCVGFVFQFHHLLPQCSALENVLVPTLVNREAGDRRSSALELLDRVGLTDRAGYVPAQLSGGERQRVAVVRALINEPRLLLADEPTGSLNEEHVGQLVELLLELSRERGMALLLVTHSRAVAGQMQRVLELREGLLHSTNLGR